MRIAVGLAAVMCALGCGNKTAPVVKKDAAPPIDAPAVDAAPADASIALPQVCKPIHGTNISLRQIATIAESAVLVTAPPSDPRLFVVAQAGRIRILDANQQLLPTPFLDISGDVNGPVIAGGEQGLLGLVFDPGYSTNRTFYVDYTAANPNNPGGFPFLDVVAQYSTSASDPNVADPASAKVILAVPDFAVNHNAGMIAFGSDGYLYISEGDGGGAGDFRGNGQNPKALLGKMLRIDVHNPRGQRVRHPGEQPVRIRRQRRAGGVHARAAKPLALELRHQR
jgi:glucose/arabinose dehydrogenase